MNTMNTYFWWHGTIFYKQAYILGDLCKVVLSSKCILIIHQVSHQIYTASFYIKQQECHKIIICTKLLED